MNRILVVFFICSIVFLKDAFSDEKKTFNDTIIVESCRLYDSIPIFSKTVFLKKKVQQEQSFVMNYGYWLSEYHSSARECRIEPLKRPWFAAAEVFALNVGVWAFDRYILKGDYAYINLHTVKQNFRTGFVWDNDGFNTNLFSHPYHGNLYFNAARASGLNFWQSVPYAIGGSLMWEFFLENEPAAINDWIATSLGGSCLGEITWRVSDLFIDQSERGLERIAREAAVFIVSPVRGINRIISGEAWKRSYCTSGTIKRPELVFSSTLNFKYLAKTSDWQYGTKGAELELNLVYGNPMENLENTPYSFFTIDAKFNFMSGQPFIGGVQAKALLWGKYWETMPDYGFLLGAFQHFNFQDSDPINNHKDDPNPYQISEAASFGVGMICLFPLVPNYLAFFSDVYVNGILLGGNYTDYYRVVDRDYNLGSGYSFKIISGVSWRKKGAFRLQVEQIHLFTWKGYQKEVSLASLSHEEMLYLNVQGDKGNTSLITVSPQLTVHFYENLELNLSHTFYLRKSEYVYFPTITYNASETKIGMTYRFK